MTTPLPAINEERTVIEQVHAVVTTVEESTRARDSIDDARLPLHEDLRRDNSAPEPVCGAPATALNRDDPGA